MESILKEEVSNIVDHLYQQKIPVSSILVNAPQKEYPCDFAVVVFPIAKLVKKSPDVAAQEIGDHFSLAPPPIPRYDSRLWRPPFPP